VQHVKGVRGQVCKGSPCLHTGFRAARDLADARSIVLGWQNSALWMVTRCGASASIPPNASVAPCSPHTA